MKPNQEPLPANTLTQEERWELLAPLVKEARRLLRVARAKGDVKLIDCAVDTLGAILEAV